MPDTIESLATDLNRIDSTAQSDRELLIRIDARTEFIVSDLKNYVRREEFLPVQAVTYSLVGIILTSVIGAVIAGALRKPKHFPPHQ